jgi:aminocarboxymuconate-semialdehyde decarboxylase
VRIDLHTHVVPPAWDDWAAKYGGAKWPRLVRREAERATMMTGAEFFRDIDHRSWSAERRLEDMDRLGITVQALSPPPVMFCYWADAKAAQAFARMQNEHVASVAASHPTRFAGMATVPLQDVNLAVEKLRVAREELDLRAVEIGTCPAGRDFDDPGLFPFFEACADLDVAVFVHPATPLAGGERLNRYYFPLTLGRLNYGWGVRPEGPAAIPHEPRRYARLLYFDSLTHSAANLASSCRSSAASGS